VYDGSADSDKFQCFVLEATHYCKEGKVAKDEQVFLVAHFLTDKAYAFFTHKVAKNHDKWQLPKFFEELFNYCFPLNYRNQQQVRLRHCYQDDRSVSEYNLFTLVGGIGKHERVIRLWDGFNQNIHYELHHGKLNKEFHSWNEIVYKAELIEMA
ncbi:hypothetical protein BT96DRAFT_772713, partial [Gymnopus androsaceus JB14]